MKKTIILLIAVVSMVSCSVYNQHPYSVSNTQLTLHLDDMEYLGERPISVDYNTIFGFNCIEKINGVIYDGKLIKRAQLSNMSNLRYKILKRALPAIYEEFPQADYIVVCNEKMSTDVLFLGSRRRAEAKVKIYSFKN